MVARNPTIVEKSTMVGNSTTIWNQLKIGLGPKKIWFFGVENLKGPKNYNDKI